MDLNEKRRRRLAAVDNEQAILEAVMPFIDRLEDCQDSATIIQGLEDLAALTGSFLANYEDR